METEKEIERCLGHICRLILDIDALEIWDQSQWLKMVLLFDALVEQAKMANQLIEKNEELRSVNN